MKKLSIAAVGAGIYRKNHLDAYTSNPNVDLVAVYDLKKEVTDKAEQDYQAKMYNDMGEMLKSEEIDTVSVTVPDPYHRDPAITAIRYRKDALVEKPLAITSTDAYDIVETAEKAGVCVTVDYHKRWDLASIAIKDKLADAGTRKPIRGCMRVDNVYDVAIN